jgi:hypothetical protein
MIFLSAAKFTPGRLFVLILSNAGPTGLLNESALSSESSRAL